ncbi:MAG: hypothetical protein PHC45_02775 [Clostridiaceae bacterium]|nr:hypothetical protein [Clostridiaceae bacterium]
MKYIAITNNPRVDVLKKEKAKQVEIVYCNDTVEQIVMKAILLLAQGGCTLAADPMGGRRARPFPYLTIILKASDTKILHDKDMKRLEDYKALDAKRKDIYETYTETLKRDYQILDASLTETAFIGISKNLVGSV